MGAVKNQMIEVDEYYNDRFTKNKKTSANELFIQYNSVKDTADYFGISQMDVEDILNAQKALDSEQL